LRDNKLYRPPTLVKLSKDLDALELEGFESGGPLETKSAFKLYEVKRGDTLSGIAKEHLGSAKFADQIFKANLDKLENKHRIYAGRVLRIPLVPLPK
ncbi:MAG: LysM peptidoglycan-binding domain-containing protein, partial [Aestuariivirga sp.]